jgi:hypothetical protein
MPWTRESTPPGTRIVGRSAVVIAVVVAAFSMRALMGGRIRSPCI